MRTGEKIRLGIQGQVQSEQALLLAFQHQCKYMLSRDSVIYGATVPTVELPREIPNHCFANVITVNAKDGSS